jgi:hypothetical protein
MKSRLNRRDFLKLAGVLPLSLAAPRALQTPGVRQPLQDGQKNVLVVVFDAFSARHLSMFGYQRETMPNLTRLVERAVVYHNHFAGSNFTTSGTASLLTGTLPWTHRALQPGGEASEAYAGRTIFSAFRDYYRIAYTHNGWANTLLEQFRSEVDELIPWKSLFLKSYDGFIQTLFENDNDIASVSWTRAMNIRQERYGYSLFLSRLYEALQDNRFSELRQGFPRGVPSTGNVGNDFLLETAVEWIGNRLTLIPQPFLGYLHFLPPHGPYNTSLEFFNLFGGDGLKPVQKPEDIFTIHVPETALLKRRAEYDEFLLYVDKNFEQLFNSLESSGMLEDTWLIFTSDHGEMFERGISGHSTNALYQPVLRIPLMIFEPGRTTRLDIHTPTSAADILPTLAHLTGHAIPDWTEGVVLPPYADTGPDPDRNVYAARATQNDQDAPLSRASTMLVKGRYKLVYYFGYDERGADELVRLFDIQDDPEELEDLYSSQQDIARELLAELKAKLAQVDKPYL